MKKLLLLLLLLPSLVFAETARDIIKRVDKNELFKTQRFSATMIIQKGSRKLVKKFNGYGQKAGEKSFMTFTNAEDSGVKYLKIGKQLWIYFPDADDIMKISGHMLRRGMMGSDISYEDMLESGDFEKKYSYKLLPDKVVQGEKCFIVECNAKVKKATYARQVLYVEKKSYAPLKIEMFAKGGRLLKKMEFYDVRQIQGRAVAMRVVIRDMRKKNSETTVKFQNIKFDEPLPGGIFTRRSLRR